MPALVAGTLWAGLIAWLLHRAVRQFGAHRSASLTPPPPQIIATGVSVIIPVRNEIRNIRDCLGTLVGQCAMGADYRIIVVDDESQDGTGREVARLASEDPRISLIAPGPLPEGWMGKPHACWHGALQAAGDWLCFVDADVRAAPLLIAAAVAMAGRQRIDMVSVQPFQRLGSLWERLIIPAGLLMIACAKDLRRINDPDSPEVSANGQFLLIRREAYFAAGGHAAVRNEICEDKALARLLKRNGQQFRMVGGECLAEARMYRDFASLWEGFAKNADEIMGSAAATLAIAIAGLVISWTSLVLPIALAMTLAAQPGLMVASGLVLALFGSAAIVAVHLAMTRHFRIPRALGLLFPLAYAATAALACHSAVLHRQGRVTWKGRTYNIGRKVLSGRP